MDSVKEQSGFLTGVVEIDSEDLAEVDEVHSVFDADLLTSRSSI